MAERKKRRRGRPRRSSGAHTKKRIIGAATRQFAAGGYEATSLRAIAAACNIDLATLKYHFGDKPRLFGEVYAAGHAKFIATMSPLIADMEEIETSDELRRHIARLVEELIDFANEESSFVRLVLYRLLEDSDSIIGLEEELQVVALAMIEEGFSRLVRRGLIRDIDIRAMITMLVAAFPMWFVAAEVRPGWIGPPLPHTDSGRDRSIAFFTEVLENYLVPLEARSGS